MSAAASRPGGFAARVRWRSEVDPAWEIETRHDGFAMPEDAALFANGFSTRSPTTLILRGGRMEMGFSDGTTRPIRGGEYQLWRLPRDFDASQPADDASFDAVEMSLESLTGSGLDGRWAQLAYGVLGPTGEMVDVILEVDETGDLKVIAIDETPGMADGEIASFGLGVVPRA